MNLLALIFYYEIDLNQYPDDDFPLLLYLYSYFPICTHKINRQTYSEPL